MVDYGTIVSVKVDSFLGSVDQYVIVDVQLTDDQDTVSCLWLPGAGRQQYPWKGDLVSLVFANQNWGIAVAASDHIAVDVAQGEQKLYSYDESRAIKAFINLLADGTLEFNGNSGNLVRWSELQTVFDNFWAAVDAAIGAGLGATLPTTAAMTAYTPFSQLVSTDIISAKATKLKIGPEA